MKTEEIGSFAAKTHFSEILEKARQGRVFIVTRRGKPVARLGPIDEPTERPVFGSAKGRVELAADFDEPIPEMDEYTR